MTKRVIAGVVLAVVAVAAIGGVAFWGYTALNQAEAETQEVRWVNLSLTIPADSDIHYARMSSAPQAVAQGIMGPVLVLTTGGDKSLVVIDAETGQVVYDDVLTAERSDFDAVLATVEVVETDVSEEAGAPWPYGSTLPSTPRERWGPITYIAPDPGAGISVDMLKVDYAEPQPPGSTTAIRVFNGRSQLHVTGAGDLSVTGGGQFTLAGFIQAEPALLEGIHPDDREAFQRFVQAVELSPPPTP